MLATSPGSGKASYDLVSWLSIPLGVSEPFQSSSTEFSASCCQMHQLDVDSSIHSQVASLISSSVAQRHLIPRLELCDLQSLEHSNTAFGQLCDTLADSEWRAAISRLVPACPYLTRITRGEGTRIQALLRSQDQACPAPKACCSFIAVCRPQHRCQPIHKDAAGHQDAKLCNSVSSVVTASHVAQTPAACSHHNTS